MTTRRYDAIVLGGGLSAAITAALLGKRGVRGLLLDQGELASADGRRFPDLVWSDAGSLAMEIVTAELGVREDLKVKSALVRPTMQAIFADQRVDLHPDRAALIAELRRAFGGVASDFAAVLERIDQLEARGNTFLATAGELPARGFFARRRVTSAAKRAEVLGTLGALDLFVDLTPELEDLLLAPLPFLGYVDAKRANEVSAVRFARLVGRFFRGLSRLEEGRSLRELFLDVARRKGFEVRKSVADTITLERGGVHLRAVGQPEDLITADVLVDASADLSGLDAIPHRDHPKELALVLQAMRPRGALHALRVVVDRDVLPPGLGPHALLLDHRRDPARLDGREAGAEDRPILLSALDTDDARRVELIAAYPVPVSLEHSDRMAALDAVVRARLERLVPFLGDGRPEISPVDGRGGGARRIPAHPYFAEDLDPLTGMGGMPVRTKLSNVYVAGPSVLPGLGAEGEYLAALEVADACAPLHGKGKAPKNLAARGPVIAGV